MLALMLGAGMVFLLDRLDSSIRTVDEAESVLEQPVLAAIPEADLSKLPEGTIVMTHDSGSSQAESFRTLRASLSLLGEENQRRLILVTSAIPSEGKTFTSTNLAAAFASQGLKTIVIDADLRRPALSATLLDREVRKAGDFRGLTDVLSGLCLVEDATRSTTVPNLFLLPSGRRAPNPAELLSQVNVEKLLQKLLTEYDRVVVDSAPVNAVSDSLALAPIAHAVCLVLRFGKTPRRAIIRAISLLQKAGARMAGLVMNRMPTSRGAAYYYYYYGDPYVADSVYGSTSKKDKKRKKTPTAEV
jgi:capsular exopolysaccharide synthesis family protein